MNWILFGIVYAIQLEVKLPKSDKPRYSFDSLIGARLAKTQMSGGYNTCFLTNLTSQGKNFLMMVDTGSTDTIFPSQFVNSYSGPVLDLAIPQGSIAKTSHYGDTSWWTGHILRTPVGLYGTAISGTAPVALMVNQSTSPIFASGDPAHGLMGLAFERLSSASQAPYSVMDAWFEQNAIPKNQVAFHGCPYRLESESWIDIGNETPYTSCNNQSATINMPYKSYFNLDLQRIMVGGKQIPFPTSFQSGTGLNKRYSILDSCTSLILLPPSMVSTFITALKNSGAFSAAFSSNFYFEQWLSADVLMSNLAQHINFALLPNITFEIATGRSDFNSTQLVLGPRQYIQMDSRGFYMVMISAGSDMWAILGLTFFSSYHITVDRTAGTMKFELGCGCKDSVDNYPQIILGNNTASPNKIVSSSQSRIVSPFLICMNLVLVILLL